MRKPARSSLIIDRLHKGFVICCIGVTLYGVGHLGMRWYRYFTVLRPENKQRELMQKQKLLSEGSSDVLQDKATNLQA